MKEILKPNDPEPTKLEQERDSTELPGRIKDQVLPNFDVAARSSQLVGCLLTALQRVVVSNSLHQPCILRGHGSMTGPQANRMRRKQVAWL